uniref:Uncharacterized protein n=1 Tax=Rhodosorus marinus TaxID=101924 RepID=A0A7S3EFB2_9RHOD|mmetsp:Transcript_29631/g.114190  ORF Transcript_29631/g.114190 Transcript_29631/m.114190 type:complete len:134 (+) Transcript_29631:72-473(+)
MVICVWHRARELFASPTSTSQVPVQISYKRMIKFTVDLDVTYRDGFLCPTLVFQAARGPLCVAKQMGELRSSSTTLNYFLKGIAGNQHSSHLFPQSRCYNLEKQDNGQPRGHDEETRFLLESLGSYLPRILSA